MGSEEKRKSLMELIPKLEGEDCTVEPIDYGIRVSFFDGHIFEIFESGGWVQVGTLLIFNEELEDMPYLNEVYEFLLLLNSRCLGCRFGLDPDGGILIVEDLLLEDVDEVLINEAMDAIAFVAYVFYDLILATGQTGVPPTEEEIDDMVTQKENSYDSYH